MSQRVLVAGYYGAGNTGDEAILTVLLRDLRALRPDLQVTVVSADPSATAARHGVHGVPGSDVAAIVDAATAADLVLLGGGGVFHDYWGCASDTVLTRSHAGIPFYAGFPLLAALAGRPSMIYAAGVGPLHTEEGRRLTRIAFEAATIATVRDAASRVLLDAIGVPGVTVTADPACALLPDVEAADTILARAGVEAGTPLIGVCLRHWDRGEPWDAIAGALDAFMERTDARAVFVPFQALTDHQLTDDVAVAVRVKASMARSGRTIDIAGGRDPATVAGLLARCDLVLGMRLHSLVFAASAGVPAVGLAYDPKVTSFMARAGLGDHAVALDAVAELGDRLSTAWARRATIRASLAPIAAQLRTEAAANAPLAVSLLDGDRPRPRATPPEWISGFALQQTRNLAARDALVDALSSRALSDADEFAAVSARADALAAEVASLRSSAAGQLLRVARSVGHWLAPPGTRMARAAGAVTWAADVVGRKGVGPSLLRAPQFAWRVGRQWLVKPRGLWALDSSQPGDPTVMLYTDRSDLFEDTSPVLRRPLSRARGRCVQVSLVATARNERASVPGWLASVAAQTRAPDEVIVVDAGSTDGTVEILQTEAARLGLIVSVLVEPDANIARGRNLAIERAHGAVVASTDLGCRLTPTWLERIVAPFEDDATMQVVAGWYVALEAGRPARGRWITLNHVTSARFLPSSRSIAFTREAWAAAGGYPEWLTLTGEDTWFALELRRLCDRWAFVPEAVVEWDAPSTLRAYWRKIHAWSVGDGESGVGTALYWRSFRRVVVALGVAAVGVASAGATAAVLGAGPALLVLGGWGLAGVAVAAGRPRSFATPAALAWHVAGESARATGFLRGAARRRDVVARRHRAARGLVFVLSGVPIDDTGGGARATQLALELLKQGWSVVFVNHFPRHETIDLGLKIRHPRLLTVALDAFAWPRFVRDHAGVFRDREVVAVVEFPLAAFLPLARTIRRAGGAVVYDLLDNWESALGGTWYSASVERQVIAQSDVLVATAPSLVDRLRRISGRAVTLLPNAVNADVFDPDRSRDRPADYPIAAWSMIYVGALWGGWLDWDLVRRLALVYPEASVVMIGDYRNQMSRPPANVRFLGLKAQAEVAAYLAQADVAILPWTLDAITHATSPLKVYEYLAMRRPVVAPRLDALAELPGVLLSDDRDAFVRNVDRARRLRVDRGRFDAFVSEHSWPARVKALLELIHASTR